MKGFYPTHLRDGLEKLRFYARRFLASTIHRAGLLGSHNLDYVFKDPIWKECLHTMLRDVGRALCAPPHSYLYLSNPKRGAFPALHFF